MAFPLENLQSLGIIGFVRVSSNGWTWMCLVFITVLTWMGLVLISQLRLWGLKGIKGFSFSFKWWGKHGQVQVMLQSFSYSPSSTSTCTAEKKNSTAFADDNLLVCRNICMDDLHLPTYRGQSLNERGIYTRSSLNRSKSCSTIDSLAFWNSVEGLDDSIEAGSACFGLETEMLFTVERSSTLSIARSVPSSASLLRSAENDLESHTLHQKRHSLPRSLIRLPKHEQLCKREDYERNEYGRKDDPMQKGTGMIIFSSDFIYDMECEERCKGSLFIMKGEGEEKQLGRCWLDNYVDLGLWRRVESFENQFGWDRVLSLLLGYDWNWNRYTGRFGLVLDKYSKYSVRDINFADVLDSPNRSLVKLLSLQEDVVSSVEIASNLGLSSAFTVSDNSTVRLWDIEVSKCLNKMVVSDYTIVGSHIQNISGSPLSIIMSREEMGSLFVLDPRDFPNPLNFSVGNMSTFHRVQFHDCNKFCISDCFNDRLFDSRMIGSSPIEVISPARLSSFLMKEETAIPIENCKSLEKKSFNHDDEEDELDNEFYESDHPEVVDFEKSWWSCFIEQFVGALPGCFC